MRRRARQVGLARRVAEEEAAVFAGSQPLALEQDGVLGVGAVLSPFGGDLDQAIRLMQEEITRMQHDPISEHELQKAKNQMLRNIVLEQLTVRSKASQLGSAAVLEGDPARCARLLDGLRGEGAAPPLILWALASETRSLAVLRTGRDSGQPLQALFKQERIFDNRRQQALGRALERLSQGKLRAALLHAARIDRMIKGLVPGDIWDEFLQLCLLLTHRLRH